MRFAAPKSQVHPKRSLLTDQLWKFARAVRASENQRTNGHQFHGRWFLWRGPKPRDQFKDLVELVPDFGRRIREAREGLGLTPEQLGARIKEKATLLKKIEREDISPEDEVRKKLERELKIKLTDQASEAQVKSGGSGRGLTLGDVANIKRK